MADAEKSTVQQVTPSEKIEQWFRAWFYNRPGLSDNTHQINYLRQAVEDLKSRMAGG